MNTEAVSDASNSTISPVMNVSSIQQIPKHDIVKLCDSTFLLWKQQVMLIVDGYGLLDYLSADVLPPSRFVQAETRTNDVNPAFSMYNRQDKLFASWLLTTVSAEVLPLLVSCNTSKSIWSTVLRMFVAKSATKISSLRHSLHTQKKCGLSVHSYLTKIRMICESLSATGITITEQEQVSVILAGLSMEFESVIAIALRELMSLEKLTEMLLDCEARQHIFLQDNLPAHANMVVQQSAPEMSSGVHLDSQSNGPQNFQQSSQPHSYQLTQSYNRGGRRGGSYPRGRNRGGRQGYNNNRPQCQLCGRIGHTVRKCWYSFDRDFLGDSHKENQEDFFSNNGIHAGGYSSTAYASGPVQQRVFVPQNHGVSIGGTQPTQGTVGYSGLPNGHNVGSSSITAGSSGVFATVPLSFAAAPASLSGPSDCSWYPDSGATHHITHDQTNLQSGTSYTGTNMVLMGNGSGVPISHIGLTDSEDTTRREAHS